MLQQKNVPPFSSELQAQVLNYTNHLSALFSVPLIEILYDRGYSTEQLHDLKAVFDILVSSSLYSDAFRLFLLIYQDVTNERPISPYTLRHVPILIPYFLFEFLEDFNSLLADFKFDEAELQ